MKLQFTDRHPQPESMLDEVCRDLARTPKCLSPKYFYDETGSRLFDAITRLPEYYLTRAELEILQTHGAELVEALGTGRVLVELGSGSSLKIRLLLKALAPTLYLPVDISRDHLLASTRTLAADYPGIAMHALCADYTAPLSLPVDLPGAVRIAFFPGSSIGNYPPEGARLLMARVAGWLGPGGALLIGVDLKKAPHLLHAAYNDSKGLTARFNLNILHHIRRRLAAHVDPGNFRHRAFYNAEAGRVEMHLTSTCRQRLEIRGRCFEFEPGETIHTENSYKYAIDEFQALAKEAGYRADHVWTDAGQRFSLHLLRVDTLDGSPAPVPTDL